LANHVLANKKYDILYIDGLQPSYLLNEILDIHQNKIPIVYRMMDAFYKTLSSYSKGLGINPISFAARLDRSISTSYEKRLWKRADIILPVTRDLGNLVAEECPDLKSRIMYFPVGIDLLDQPKQDFESTQRVLYIGTVHYPPNQLGLKWFLRECWPLVLENYPSATLDIVGRGGKKLAPLHPSVRVHEYLGDL
jgi:glycosyltransferase involved in cell wall biosynthesis